MDPCGNCSHSQDDKPDRYEHCHMRKDDDSGKCPCQKWVPEATKDELIQWLADTLGHEEGQYTAEWWIEKAKRDIAKGK
jgi:hypothetical protein